MTFRLPDRLNIAELFLDRRVEEGRGGRTAVVSPEGRFTYTEVQRRAHRVGGVLRRLGVRAEERVLIALPDGIDFVAALFGTLEVGAVAVMMNPRLEPEVVTALCRDARAALAVVDAGSMPPFEAARGNGWRGDLLLVGEGPEGPVRLAEWSREVPDHLDTVATHRDDPAIWLFSGGSTGRPKAVVQTHGSFANTTELYGRRTLGLGPGDVTLSVPKLYFGYATGTNLFFPFSVGATSVLFPEHPTAEVVFDRIRQHRPTVLVNVPTMVSRMVEHPAAGEQDLSTLRFATSAGEALPVPLYRRWRETFGVELLDGLGTAEMWHVFLTNRPGDIRPGTLGRPVEGFEVRARDEEGRDVGDGEVGRLWVRGQSRAWGYWQDLPQTASTFRGEWVALGDLVRRDPEGYFHYCGRADDCLKVGGRWLEPREVESCLMRHPRVRECAVVGVTTDRGLVKPMAVVVAEGDAAGLEDELKAWVLEQLQPYKHPRRVVVLDDLPRTHLGKVDRGALKRSLEGASR